MELKQKLIALQGISMPRFNRTFMELKLNSLVKFVGRESGFNRTFMELKLICLLTGVFISWGFNRTFMELKQ